MLDPLNFNRANLAPTADRPLLIIFRGDVPSLKNRRQLFVNQKTGKIGNKPNKEVEQAIARIRDTLHQQLDPQWSPIGMPQGIKMWMILGAHGVTSLPDSDLDNLAQTTQEALAPPRTKEALTEQRRKRLIMQDDKQVISLHAIRRAFADKDRIYHELYIWASSPAVHNPMADIEEYSRVARLREEALNAETA